MKISKIMIVDDDEDILSIGELSGRTIGKWAVVIASVPVIFMTARAQRHEIEQYERLGAAGVIRKPFDPTTLPDEVRRIVERG